MHPDLVSIGRVGYDGVCESLVGCDICVQGGVVEDDFVELIVEERPDGGVFLGQ